MKTDLFTVSKIFTERLMRIPDYQRGYAWTEKHLKDYWTDLSQLDEGKSHYIGVLTLEDVPHEKIQTWDDDQWIINAKGYAPFFIVDGQQRLTTTIILIQAITECVPKGKKLNYTSVEDIRRKFLWDSRNDGISRSYIFGYEKDNPSYQFLKTKIFLEASDSSYPVQETIYTHNLEFAKRYFIERIKNLSFKEIETIYRKVTQYFLFNIYAISQEVDVFVAFETMNNRGKPLSHLELLKNRLIYLSTKFDVEGFEKKKLRTTINESWKAIYHYLGKNKDKPLDDDLFLQNHFLLYFGHTLMSGDDEDNIHYRRLRRGYRLAYKDYLLEQRFTAKNIAKDNITNKEENKFTTQDIYTYAKSLKESVELWYQILNPEDSNFSEEERIWFDKLNRLKIEQVAPLIMVFFQTVRNHDQRVGLLKILEQLLFFDELVRYRYYLDYNETLFLKLSSKLSSKQIKPEKVIKELKSVMDKGISSKEIWKHIVTTFKDGGHYQWNGLKYFLYEYDLYLKTQTKTYRKKIDWSIYNEDERDYHTVEHIYPQRPRKKCWTDLYKNYSAKERSALRHSLGNLVPLSRPKNSSFQNKCFIDKLGTEDNKVGFKYGSYSENEIANKSQWTAKDIFKRGIKLLKFMEIRWNLSIGDKNRKIKMLGLEFMVKKKKRITKPSSRHRR